MTMIIIINKNVIVDIIPGIIRDMIVCISGINNSLMLLLLLLLLLTLILFIFSLKINDNNSNSSVLPIIMITVFFKFTIMSRHSIDDRNHIKNSKQEEQK